MALCGHEAGWPCGRSSGDPPRERCLQGDAGEVGPQRRPQDRATDAARLVPAGTLQVDHGPGDPRDADGAQAGAEQAAGPREQPARGRISKHGDASVREALYEAAHIMLTKPIKSCSGLKSWAMRIARRAGTNKAKVALARKLAVIMLRML